MSLPYTGALIEAGFKTPPFDHQIKEFEAHVGAPARARAWTMRTGKSKATIDRACHLYTHGGENGKANGLLIFAPNGVHANWVERELPAHCWPSVPYSALVWRSRESGAKAVNGIAWKDFETWTERRAEWWDTLKTVKTDPRLMVLAINSESMTRKDVRKAVARFVQYRRVYAVWDESDDFGAPGSIRTKMARALARRCPYRDILSGTLIDATPLAAFSQYELLEKGALGFDTFDAFKEHFAEYVQERTKGGRKFPKLVGFKNLPELRERMARFTSVVLREDCKDMPELILTLRKIKPSAEQLEAYRALHRDFVIDVAERRVSVGARAPRFQKLQQVFSGFVIDEHGDVQTIPGENPRLEALSEEVYLAPGKVIIWCQFQRDIDLVSARLLADGHKVVAYHGRVSDKAKSQALTTFRENRDVKALVGHAKSGGRGLDMSAASKIIVYSHTFSARTRRQMLERATKIGGRNIEVKDFETPGPDVYIRETIAKRIDIADDIAGRGMRDFLEGIAL